MKKLIFIIIFFSFFVTNAFSQNNPKLIQHVLSKHEIGKTFSFDLSNTSDGYLKVFITYLGTVSTLANKEYNIVTWGNVWGPNRHSDGVVYLFNTNDKYFGCYYLSGILQLPSKIVGNDLIFENKNEADCDTTLINKISFDSIPRNIFLRCKGN